MTITTNEMSSRDMTDNPYAPTQSVDETPITAVDLQLRSLSRIYKWLGWFAIVLFVLVSLGHFIMLIRPFAGRGPIGQFNPLLALPFDIVLLAVGVCLLRASRRIALRDYAIRRWALFLSCVVMLLFPVFTIVGAICFYKVYRFFVEPQPDTP